MCPSAFVQWSKAVGGTGDEGAHVAVSCKVKDPNINVLFYQVFYPSRDGTKIPMFLVHAKGIKKDGSNPVFLYGYGGFEASIQPYYK